MILHDQREELSPPGFAFSGVTIYCGGDVIHYDTECIRVFSTWKTDGVTTVVIETLDLSGNEDFDPSARTASTVRQWIGVTLSIWFDPIEVVPPYKPVDQDVAQSGDAVEVGSECRDDYTAVGGSDA
jgi:hypothetical protein